MNAETYEEVQELGRMTVGELREKYLDVFGEETRSYHEWGRLGDAVAEYEKLLTNYSAGRIGWCVSSVKVHYLLGVAYEQSGWTDKAIEQYETFLDIWKNADPGIFEIDDAKKWLASLNNDT